MPSLVASGPTKLAKQHEILSTGGADTETRAAAHLWLAESKKRSWRSDLLLQSVVSSTFFDMPAINVSPALFEIETASPEADDPENEMFMIRMRLQGTYEVREFLSDHGIDEKRIAFAIEELSRTKRVKVSHQVWKGRAV